MRTPRPRTIPTIHFGGRDVSLKQLCADHGIKYNSARTRYYANKDADPEWILFGRRNAEAFTGLSQSSPSLAMVSLTSLLERWGDYYLDDTPREVKYTPFGAGYLVNGSIPLGDIAIGVPTREGQHAVPHVQALYYQLVRGEKFLSPDDKENRLGKILPRQVLDTSRWDRITIIEAMLLLAPNAPNLLGLEDWSVPLENGVRHVPLPRFEGEHYGS